MAKIAKISTVQVNTQYGQKDKYLVTVEQGGKQIQADSFVGKWNHDWVLGLEIEIKPEQWKKREYNGKTYWSIMAPPEAKGNFVDMSGIKAQLESHEGLINSLCQFMGKYEPILKALAEKAQAEGIEPVISQDEDIPVVEEDNSNDDLGGQDEVRLEDVPF